VVSTALWGLALGLLPACERGEPARAPQSRQGFVAFIGASQDDPLWPTLSATADRYREGLGHMGLEIRAPKIRSANAQADLIRALHSPQMRGLCIEPADQEIMRDVLCELQVKGVAVVTMMKPIECEDPLPFAGLDEMAVGQALADAVVTTLDGKGTIAVLDGDEELPALRDRGIGFRERMRQWPAVDILREMNCDGKPFVAERMIRDYMERFPRLDAWVALDDWPLREFPGEPRLLPKTCQLVTTNPYPCYWPLLYDGTCAALVGSEYERVAQEALHMCQIAIQGEPLSLDHYLAPPVTVTVRNLNWYRRNWFKHSAHVADATDAETAETSDDHHP